MAAAGLNVNEPGSAPIALTEPRAALSGILETALQLIKFPSTSGAEIPVMEFAEDLLKRHGWVTSRWAIPNDSRWNIFATASTNTPTIVFTTHLDVVPADEALFSPRLTENSLIGRGSTDAKGIAAVLIEAANNLRQNGATDIGLLFVVDEERRSVGAVAAAPLLKEQGVQYIINGEPTEGRLVTAQKGLVKGVIKVEGKSCHSGYPQLGADANAFAVRVANLLLDTDFGHDPRFGKATINLGKISGGVAPNVVSPFAELSFWIRSVGPSAEVRKILAATMATAGDLAQGAKANLEVLSGVDPFELLTLPTFPAAPVSYSSDILPLSASGAKCLMYGPGSIREAHTATEFILFSALAEAYVDYQRLYHAIKSLA